jgi:hypothetical protein
MSIVYYTVVAACVLLLVLLLLWIRNPNAEYFYVPVRHSVCDLGHEPKTAKERKLIVHVGRTLRGFLKHLDTYHGSDARTLRAMQAWNGRVKILYDEKMIVRFSRNTGCLFINPDVSEVWNNPSKLNALLLRHLAHKTCCSYNAKWMNTYVFYIRVATEELGMDVSLGCDDCTRYGLCRLAMCPECSWETRCEKS